MRLKMLALAVIAIAAAMAVFGASLASATVLCQEAPNEGLCPPGKTYSPKQEIFAAAEKPLLVTAEEDVTCETSEATLKTSNTGGPGEAVEGTVTALTFTGCELTGGTACTVKAIHTPYLAEIKWVPASNGDLAVKNGGSGEPGATVSCGGLLACVFSAEPLLGVEGSNPAVGSASKVAMKLSKEEGFMKCPEKATWDATYEATSPTAIYVAEESGSASVLCKEAPKEGVCPEGKMYPAEQVIEAKAVKLVLKNSIDTINCGGSTFKSVGETLGSGTEPATGQVQVLWFFECKTTNLGLPCTLVAINLQYEAPFNWLSGSSGTLALKEFGENGEPKVQVKCGFSGTVACVFSLEELLPFEGGNPARFTLPETQLRASKVKGFEMCPNEANWEKVTYETLSPTALYLARE